MQKTTDKNAATHIKIISTKFPNHGLTIGNTYPLSSKFIGEDFEDELYVIDDHGKENAGVFILYEIELYK